MFKPKIAIFVSNADLKAKGQILAERLQLPCIFEELDTYDYLLLLTPDFLGLKKTNPKSKPLIIDFLSGNMQIRRKQASLRKEFIARAMGLKDKTPRKIVDTTAGLARDSFILASLGFEVQLIERSPIIHALIEDAIKRASKDPVTGEIVKRLHLVNADAIDWLTNHYSHRHTCESRDDDIDIIYLDPMFPQSKKSALSKQDMRIFHEVVGDDLDANQLLTIALTCAKQRVVVKRPRHAEPLGGIKPTLSMEGSSNRFDIYLTRSS